jgi:hypothetical protein
VDFSSVQFIIIIIIVADYFGHYMIRVGCLYRLDMQDIVRILSEERAGKKADCSIYCIRKYITTFVTSGGSPTGCRAVSFRWDSRFSAVLYRLFHCINACFSNLSYHRGKYCFPDFL